MLTSGNLNDMSHARIAAHLPRFRAAPVPDPGREEWTAWIEILAMRAYDPVDGPRGAMCVEIGNGDGFGTVSSSLTALAAPGSNTDEGSGDRWLFAAGPPDRTAFAPVEL